MAPRVAPFHAIYTRTRAIPFIRPGFASFLAWVQQALVPTLSAGDIVIMDNLSSHKVAGPDCFSQPPTVIAEWASDRESGPEPS